MVTLPTPHFELRQNGYAFAEVDQFIGMLLEADQAGKIIDPRSIQAVRFSLTTAQGYAVSDVDAWLNSVAQALAQRSGRPPATRTQRPPQRPAQQAQRPPVAQPPVTARPTPAPYEEVEKGFDLPKELAVGPLSLGLGGRSAAELDPGRNAVQELPSTPPWASLIVLIGLAGLIAFFVYSLITG